MKSLFRKLIIIIKMIFICLVIAFVLIYVFGSVPEEKQYFDFTSASLISTGISTSFCLCINSRKKE